MFLDKIVNTQSEIAFSIDYLKKSELPLVLYGGSIAAELALKLLLHNNIAISHVVVDEKYFISNSFFHNHMIERINDVLDLYPKINIIVAHGNYQADIARLSQNPIVAYCCFFDMTSLEFDFGDYYDTIQKHASEFEKLYLQLADEHSRELMGAFINAKISGNLGLLVNLNVNGEQQYFPEFLKLSDDEVFVDCGAFDGDTIISFINKTKGKYSKIYAFEPDKNNIEKLFKNTSLFNNIEIIEKGCFSCKDTLYFHDGEGISSSISNQGNVIIEVDAIYNVVSGKVTFIKIDIEGSELQALKGGQRTIRKNLPVLAVSVYHKPEDLFSLPQYIYELSDSYKFYLRHYGLWSSELVLYAISNKQLNL